MTNNKSTILVIFGISGDLAKRYLLGAISAISHAGMLPDEFHILGLTRQHDIKKEDLLKNIPDSDYIYNHLEIRSIHMDDIDEFKKLNIYIDELEKNFNICPQRLFYLSVPPQASKLIVKYLGESGISRRENTKLLLEKPFGTDLENAIDLALHINKYFDKESIYRVDHYLAKDTVQNIIIFRDGNSLFKKTWNNNFIEKIDVIVSEKLGIEGRANFYEQSGALRDMIQSHLFQLLSLTIMDLPNGNNLEEIPSLRLEALKKLKIVNTDLCIRGQYDGYKEDVNNPTSKTETFASVLLESSDPKWVGVPIRLTTGKALEDRFSEIRVSYKKENDNESNELIIRIQPKGGIQFNMWAKNPGYEYKVSPHNLSFNFEEYYGALPQAYEQVLFNVINSDHSLFTLSEEVIETWRILDELEKKWKENDKGMIIYKKGMSVNELI